MKENLEEDLIKNPRHKSAKNPEETKQKQLNKSLSKLFGDILVPSIFTPPFCTIIYDTKTRTIHLRKTYSNHPTGNEIFRFEHHKLDQKSAKKVLGSSLKEKNNWYMKSEVLGKKIGSSGSRKVSVNLTTFNAVSINIKVRVYKEEIHPYAEKKNR